MNYLAAAGFLPSTVCNKLKNPDSATSSWWSSWEMKWNIIPMPEPFLRACPWPSVFPQSYLGIVGQGGIFYLHELWKQNKKAAIMNYSCLKVYYSSVYMTTQFLQSLILFGGMVTNLINLSKVLYMTSVLTPEYPCLAQQFRGSIKTNNSRKYDPKKTGDSPHFLAESVPNRGVCLEARSFNPQKKPFHNFFTSFIMVQLPFQRIFMIVCCDRCNPLLWLCQSIKNLETSLRYGLRPKVTTSLQPLTTDFSGSCNLSRLQKTYPPKKRAYWTLRSWFLCTDPLRTIRSMPSAVWGNLPSRKLTNPTLGKICWLPGGYVLFDYSTYLVSDFIDFAFFINGLLPSTCFNQKTNQMHAYKLAMWRYMSGP